LFVNAKVHIVAQQGITDAFPETGFSGFYKRLLKKKVYKEVDLIHAWGEVMVPAMVKAEADLKKIMVIPKGLDLDFYGFKDPFTRNIQAKAIVTRSLSDVYHHEVIIDAISILNLADSQIQLTIVGDGPRKDFLMNKVKELQVENLVTFVGRIPNEDLPQLLQESSIYISVPETEGVSASLFEAMASGCFPIVTELPGTKAFIRDGDNGYLIPTNDAVALAGAIQSFLSSSDKFYPAINQNRRYIESNVNLATNMKKIYSRYLSLLEQVN
jgi:glycosyltransferase involved in cell wall biosynthesis